MERVSCVYGPSTQNPLVDWKPTHQSTAQHFQPYLTAQQSTLLPLAYKADISSKGLFFFIYLSIAVVEQYFLGDVTQLNFLSSVVRPLATNFDLLLPGWLYYLFEYQGYVIIQRVVLECSNLIHAFIRMFTSDFQTIVSHLQC